ncbi:MAG: hypothetical protein C6P37_00455 [Caldibacillus debilis]|uniref:Uncharacterized protein n=1 Tax=Caldibacillus debilis TaxID=301148 RepID=A0A3E0K982_9BACI|nr:MAG: hypothetical protein BAA03_14955 [Caldibacillus debilis]REJ14521.1 MAG: hypothetical protein C6W57_13865 [Caldibacillus debilis]REJ30364.1 MAG: hypothetical protein C6W56_03015 [Caldibacillus debilis]REJ31557.1 MAG: hypothetical protein C6P37_00455 [Caldibacillus debilis]
MKSFVSLWKPAGTGKREWDFWSNGPFPRGRRAAPGRNPARRFRNFSLIPVHSVRKFGGLYSGMNHRF